MWVEVRLASSHSDLPLDGVRAGAKRLGGRDETLPPRDAPIILESGMIAHT